MKRFVFWTPLALVLLLGIVVAATLLRPADRVQRSRLVGRPVPAFSVPPMQPGRPGLASADLGGGGPRLVNLFASWCVPCIAEAPSLLELERRGVRIDAIAVRDEPGAVAGFLQRHGDPFVALGDDRQSRAQVALGSSGVPESFVVDAGGVIRHHHLGPIMPQDMGTILQALERAR